MDEQEGKLIPHLTPAGAWAMALGTSVGWGSLVITSNTYLTQAGPLGTMLGLIAGALVMLVVSYNYAYLMKMYPSAGGAYTYVRETFGFDRAFLVSWFLTLTYLAMLWANATALPLFVRYFLGDIFEFGKLYTLFDYDVYLGEAILTISAIVLIGLLCANSRKITAGIMLAMVGCFTAAITVCFIAAVLNRQHEFSPAFIPDSAAISQILRIAVISPWAFIGFENISHASEEFAFRRTRSFRVLVASVATATLLYLFVTLMSVTAYPDRYDSWLAYIRDTGSLEGIEALPAFYAAQHYLGAPGVAILMIALLALVLTSLIGNTLALSRLFCTLGRDKVLPAKFGTLNRKHIPGKAILLIACVSLLVPFVGRTAIGWVVDVTTLGAVLIYGFVSACALKTARLQTDRKEAWSGMFGLAVMTVFGLYMLVPSLFSTGTVEPESYFLFVVWSVLGIIFFRSVIRRDGKNRFGRSVVVWIALLSLIVFVSLVWMNQSVMGAAQKGIRAVEDYYRQDGIQAEAGVSAMQMEQIRSVNTRSIAVVVGLFGLALGLLLNNYSLMRKKAEENETMLSKVREMANTDPLTGVKSKHAYMEAEKAHNGEIAAGAAPDFAVVVCDVNGLKHINDTLGHKAGDEYICKACKIICWIFEHSPVYRMGGDEFVVYLKGVDYDNRSELMKMLHERSVEHIRSGDAVVSGGMSEFIRGQDDTVHEVFERADALMYQEKQRLKAMGATTRE